MPTGLKKTDFIKLSLNEMYLLEPADLATVIFESAFLRCVDLREKAKLLVGNRWCEVGGIIRAEVDEEMYFDEARDHVAEQSGWDFSPPLQDVIRYLIAEFESLRAPRVLENCVKHLRGVLESEVAA